MGFFYFLCLLLLAPQESAASEVAMTCTLKDGASADLAFALSCAETSVSPMDNPKISYRIQASCQDVIIGDTPKTAIDYRIEKTDDGKKLGSWKFPREFLSKANPSLSVKVKGKTPQSDLKITCNSSGASE